MPLNNSQHDSIIREYQLRQTRHRHALQARTDEAYADVPRLAAIDREIASVSIQSGRRLLSGDEHALEQLRRQISALSEERAALLSAAGYPADFLQMTYDCKDCKDTGYIGNQKCHCFRKAEIDLLYQQSNLRDVLKLENFDCFSLEYYSESLRDPVSGLTALENAREAAAICRSFACHFDTSFENLLLYGDTGVGKTFLSHCIAKELIESIHSVIYFSAQDFFDRIAKERFGKHTEERDFSSHIYDCDLLIIDDLGTEMTNSFVISELFLCINERLQNQKSTVISTNLPLAQLQDLYSERIFSRIMSSYTLVKMFGEDIRLKKHL